MAKMRAYFTGVFPDEYGRPEARFTLKPSALKVAESLSMNEYEIDIEKPKRDRTLNQNALLWSLIGEISKNENGSFSDVDRIYSQILEMAAVKCFFVSVSEDNLDELKKAFRLVLVKERIQKDLSLPATLIVQCFSGTSQLSTDEMGKVIEMALSYAEQRNIDVDLWRDKLLNQPS